MSKQDAPKRRGHLVVTHLSKYFPVRAESWLQRLRRDTQWLRAVDDVSFSIAPGTTFGLVGESGCGKSTLGRSVLRLLEPTAGSIVLDDEDVSACSKKRLFELRQRMQIVFQDPFASLSPRRTIAQTLLEPLNTHEFLDAEQRMSRVHQLLEMVGLRPQILNRYPHEFSGGQRQRVGIARALALNPSFIVADEAVSALDVSVQSQVLNLLRDLQQELGLSCLFIAHDLAVVQHISDVVAVMYLGKLVEIAPVKELFANPRHPYTQTLLAAVPEPKPKLKSKLKSSSDDSLAAQQSNQVSLSGEVPSPLNLPSGCAFHPRCPHAMPRCSQEVPRAVEFDQASETDTASLQQPHSVSCHLY